MLEVLALVVVVAFFAFIYRKELIFRWYRIENSHAKQRAEVIWQWQESWRKKFWALWLVGQQNYGFELLYNLIHVSSEFTLLSKRNVDLSEVEGLFREHDGGALFLTSYESPQFTDADQLQRFTYRAKNSHWNQVYILTLIAHPDYEPLANVSVAELGNIDFSHQGVAWLVRGVDEEERNE